MSQLNLNQTSRVSHPDSVIIVPVQLLLNQGEKLDWFDSNLIVTCMFVGAGFIWISLVHTSMTLHPYLNLTVFKNREFTIGIILMFFAHFMTYGYVGLLPPILQDQLGFPVIDAGMIIANRGVGTMCAHIVPTPRLAIIIPASITGNPS